MADAKKPTDQERIAQLEQQLRDLQSQIFVMQRMGGFADAKTLGIRCTRIEERLEREETDGLMLKDLAGLATEWMVQHLRDRHDVAESDNRADSIFVRKIRRRLAEWAEKVGLMSKRRDVKGSRADENRLRPQAANS
jgi:hypothetical protein